MVNEMLVQIENYPYPIGCTTNHMELIEPAFFRRFLFHVEFKFLTPEKYAHAYKSILGFEPLSDISKAGKITPALFSRIKNMVQFLKVEDPQEIHKIFLEQVKLDQDKKPKTINSFEEVTIPKVGAFDKKVEDNIPRLHTSIVEITSSLGNGSGFIISEDGFVLTNEHVVENDTNVIVTLYSGREVPAEVIRTVKNNDVALLKMPKSVYNPLPLRFDEPNVGSSVYLVGSPHRLTLSTTKGIVSGYQKDQKNDGVVLMNTDCAGGPGSSGGAIIDELGNIIAVNMGGYPYGIRVHMPIAKALEALNVKVKEG